MSVNQLLVDALGKYGFPIAQDLYKGDSESYFTFTYADDRPGGFSDNVPEYVDMELYISLYLPSGENYLELKRDVARTLKGAGFTYPSIEQLLDKEADKRHLIFDCMIRMNEKEE